MTSSIWFCSSFESSSSSDAAAASSNGIVRQRKRRHTRNVARTPTPLITLDEDDDECEVIYDSKMPESIEEVPCTSGQDQSMSFLVDRFPPHNVEQLGVNPKKVDELRKWMEKKRGRSRECKLLLLTGPTGSGKTATVRVLCDQLKLELIEWNCSDLYEIFYDEEGEEVIYEENQVRRFAEFLKSADRASVEKPAWQKVVLIEQIPNAFYREPSILDAVIRQNIRSTVCMYIFIMSDVDSCWYLSPKRILPINIRIQLGLDHIAFNASATTFLTKALRRITSLLNVNVSSSQLKRVAENSNGDIRTAINNLQLCIDNDKKKFTDIIPLYSSTLVEPYHCLGKLLYAKRCDKSDANWTKAEEALNVPLRKIYARNFPPKDDINDVLDRSGINGDKLVQFLHEHEANFAPSLSSLSRILQNMSLLDSALGRWEVRTDSALSFYEGEVAARSTVFYNYGQNGSRQGKGLYQFYKPRCQDQDFQVFNKRKEIYAAFPSHISGELFSLTLPMIRLIRPPTLDYHQQQVLVSMNTTAFGSNFALCQSRMNQKPSKYSAAPVGEEEEEFDIEEIDV